MPQQIQPMKPGGRECVCPGWMGTGPPCHGGGQGPQRIREGDIEFGIGGTPEGQDMVKGQGLEIGIFEDMQAIIPQHKGKATDLPKHGERHEHAEQRAETGEPGGGGTPVGHRVKERALAYLVRAVAHGGFLCSRSPLT